MTRHGAARDEDRAAEDGGGKDGGGKDGGGKDGGGKDGGGGARALTYLVAGAFFMEYLDGTVIATALPAMARSFGTRPAALGLGMSAYLLTLAVLIPASGWVADRFGARRVFTFAIALFTAASVLCGTTTSLAGFVAARVLQGVGGALMVPVGRLVVVRGTPKAELMGAIATLTWPALVAPVLGPPVGGFITAAASWRWIFFLNIPFGLAGLVLSQRLVPDTREGPRPFDAAGFVLNGAALAGLLYGLDRLGEPGTSLACPALILAAALAVGAAAVRHALTHASPLVSLAAFRVRSFTATMAGGSLSRLTLSAMPFLLPLLFQVGLGRSPVASGLLMLWFGVANMATKAITSPLLRRFGFRNVLAGNGALAVVSIASFALVGPATPLPALVALLMVAGFTRSVQFTAINTLAFADVPAAGTNAASTLSSAGFQLMMGLGIATGALLLRVGGGAVGAVDGAAGGGAAFRVAFVLLAAVAALPLLDYLSLPADAGSVVSSHRRRAGA